MNPAAAPATTDAPSSGAGSALPTIGEPRTDRQDAVAKARWNGGMAAIIGLAGALWSRWICDDAFISIRYADNLLAGRGLVWNPGERVEGITNLLWTLLIALGRWLGGDAQAVGEGLGLACFAALLGVVWHWEHRRDPAEIPWATVLLALLPDLRIWATGGLETMGSALVATAQVVAIWQGRRSLGGWLAATAWWLRPDAALSAGVIALADAAMAWPDRPQVRRRLLLGAAPLASAVAATTLWRLWYFGDAVPNTFWAKSASSGWWSQGLVYLGLAASTAWPAVLALAWALWKARRLPQSDRQWIQTIAVTAGLHAVYVVHTGGDFMHARRLIPILPLCVLAARLALDNCPPPAAPRPPGWPRLLGLALAAIPIPVYAWAAQGRIHGVADERAFYPQAVIDLRIDQGRALGEALRGVSAPLLIEGGLCVLAWASDLPAIVEANGLTNKEIARQPLSSRSLAGHEKHPSEAWLDEHHVSAVVLHAAPQRPPGLDIAWHAQSHAFLALRYYQPQLLAALERAGWQVPQARSAAEAAARAAREAPCDLAPRLIQHLSNMMRLTATGAERQAWVREVDRRCPRTAAGP